MKILVLNGSPKRDKSDTMHITRAFLDGMKEVAPQDIHIIHTVDQHIEYCTGCFSCMRNGGACIHNDDMKAILEEILDSDLLIWSFPLYCYGMPAPLKALLDRTLPLSSMVMQKDGDRYEHVGQADFSHLRYLMICGCGFPNSRQNFEPAVMQFKLCFRGDHTIIYVQCDRSGSRDCAKTGTDQTGRTAVRRKGRNRGNASGRDHFPHDSRGSVRCYCEQRCVTWGNESESDRILRGSVLGWCF